MIDADGQLELPAGVSLPLSGMTFTASRSGGPGGQNVNKVNTKVTLTVPAALLEQHLPEHALRRLPAAAGARLAGDRLVIAASDSRSQVANRRACLARLRAILVEALHRPRTRRPTKPSRASVQRRLDQKKQRGQTKRLRQRPERQD